VNHARIKYWSPDAQLEAVKQRLKHLVAARRYTQAYCKGHNYTYNNFE